MSARIRLAAVAVALLLPTLVLGRWLLVTHLSTPAVSPLSLPREVGPWRASAENLLGAEVLAQIEAWPDDRGLNTLARRHPDAVRELAITTRPMPIDVNTPEDYDRLCGRD